MIKRKLRSPIWWIGGKGNMVKKLLNLLPDKTKYNIYVEVFGGGASLLFAKEPYGNEVYNDINGDLVNFFRVLRDKEKFEEFYRLVSLTPYSREEYYWCRDNYKNIEDPVKRAWAFFVVARMSFSGSVGSGWSYTRVLVRGMGKVVSGYLSIIELLPEIHERFMKVQVENDTFEKIIDRYDSENTLHYIDPPYLPETRKSKKLYEYEMSYEDHERLIDILLNIKGKAMVSGYANNLYKKLEDDGWKRIDFNISCYAAGRTRQTGILGKGSATEKQPRVESVWINYDLSDKQLDIIKKLKGKIGKILDGKTYNEISEDVNLLKKSKSNKSNNKNLKLFDI